MNWNDFFEKVKTKEYFIELMDFIDNEYKNNVCYPPRDKIFEAFKLTSLDNLKVVIFGQDPYFNKGEANGLAFSVNENVKLPPSLKNIFKEINIEYNKNINDIPTTGDLSYLALQGVLLLNTYLTVKEKSPLSHKNKLYDYLMKDLLEFISSIDKPIVFLLWGNNSKKLKKYLTNPKHLIIETTHPSPLGANKGGWFNSNQFIKCNEYLKSNNIKEINWIKM